MTTYVIQYIGHHNLWQNVCDGNGFMIEFLTFDAAASVAMMLASKDNLAGEFPVFRSAGVRNYIIKDSHGVEHTISPEIKMCK